VSFEFPLFGLGFFARSSRMGDGSRAVRTSAGCAIAAASGRATGAGDASASVAKRSVVAAATFMVDGWRCWVDLGDWLGRRSSVWLKETLVRRINFAWFVDKMKESGVAPSYTP